MLYNGVYDYLAPTSIFGGAIIDLRPQGNSRSTWDNVYKRTIEQFDRTKAQLPNGYTVTFEYDKGTPTMRVAQNKAPYRAILDPMSDPTGWTNSGSASAPVQDTVVYYDAPASIRFNLAAAGSAGTLTKTIDSSDLSTYEGVGVAFISAYIPNASAVTSIGIRIGSSASNYVQQTNTTGFIKAFQSNEWNLISFDLSTAIETGIVDWTKITYLQVFVNYNGTALNNFRFGSFFLALSSPHELIFQTSYLFLVGSTLSNTITDDNDQIILNDAAFTLLEYEAAKAISIQMGGTLSTGIVQTINSILEGAGTTLGLYAMYRSDNPSQEIRLVGSWYD